MKRKFILHPFIFSIYPILFLLSHNIAKVTQASYFEIIFLIIIAPIITYIILIFLKLILKDVEKDPQKLTAKSYLNGARILHFFDTWRRLDRTMPPGAPK